MTLIAIFLGSIIRLISLAGGKEGNYFCLALGQIIIGLSGANFLIDSLTL
jgi:hypothetical protein